MDVRRIVHNLQDEEEIRGVYHQFALAFFWHWLGATAVFLSSFFLLYLLLKWGTIGTILLALLFLGGLFWFVRTWRLWYYSILVLTDQRLIVLDQQGMFDRSVSQTNLDKINDVSYRKKGVLQTACNYGSLAIQVSSSADKLILKNLRKPALLQQEIFDLQSEYVDDPVTEFSEADLLSVMKEIRSRVGERRWKTIAEGEWELKQELIDEMSEESNEKARAIEQFFSREI